MSDFHKLSKDVYIYKDSVYCGIIKNGDDVLLIDCGDGLFLPCLDDIGAVNIKTALFTHHHADVASGCWKLNAVNAAVGVPKEEKHLFADIDTFFTSKESQYERYDQNPSVNCIRKSVRVSFSINDGDEFNESGTLVKAISTPGHTAGSMSYIVSTKEKTIAFVGDLIYDYGKILNLYSLQQKGGYNTDYHGFLGGYLQLINSLDRILDCNPDVLVPSHGHIIYNPNKAIIELKQNLIACYSLYKEVSSINHWYNEPNAVIKADIRPTPNYILEYDTTRIIVSEDRSAFVIDCGNKQAVDYIDSLIADKTITSIDGIWVSHYHDDHVSCINMLKERYNCKVYCHVCFSDLLTNPNGYILPCLYEAPIQVDYQLTDFEDIIWKEFVMTNCYFPGQTIYHAALCLYNQRANERVLFVGDSFTPTGIDDYCSYNINPLKLSDGYFYCIDLLENMPIDCMINQHQPGSFVFSEESLHILRDNLMKRFNLFSKLLPESDVNYGLYPNWISSYPYSQTINKGDSFNIKFSLDNYTNATDNYVLQLRLPVGLGNKTKDFELNITPNGTRHVSFTVKSAKNIAKGTHLIGLALWKNNKFLGEQCHAKLIVE